MIQFYTRNDLYEEKAYNVFRALMEPFSLAVTGFFQNIDGDPNIGRAIREEGIVPFSSVVQPEMFDHTWGRLVNMIQDWGVEEVLTFIVAIYGENLKIIIDPPMNILVSTDLEPGSVEDTYWIGKKPAMVTYSDKDYIIGHIPSSYFYMLFRKVTEDVLSVGQISFLLKHLRPAGEVWHIEYRR